MRLFRVRGADVVCSPLLLLALPAAFILGRGRQAAVAFVSLTLHEAAHAAAAKRAGCTVSSIEAQPFGFVARLDCRFADHGSAASVFAAGPIASLCAAASAALIAKYALPLLGSGAETALDLLDSVISKNLLIAAVNLLPALPLDGGRLLLALICGAENAQPGKGVRVKAVRVLSASGVIAGAAFVAVSILLFLRGAFNPTFLLMGGFLIFAAVKEAKRLRLPQRHKRLTSRDAIAVRQIAVGQDVTVASALSMLPAGAFAMITVLGASHERIGTIDESELMDAAAQLGACADMRSAVAYCRAKVI